MDEDIAHQSYLHGVADGHDEAVTRIRNVLRDHDLPAAALASAREFWEFITDREGGDR